MNENTIEEAARRREEAEAQLYRPDGSKFYSDEEHAERMAAIKREHAAAFDRIEGDISRKVGEAEQALLLAENSDPSDALTTSEFQRAQAKSQFVADDAERLSLDKLAQRCRAAAASGDKVSMFLWSHHAYARVGDSDVTSDEPGADKVREAVAQLMAKLAPDQERTLAEARQAHEEAQALRELAYYKKRGVDDAYGLYVLNVYGTPSS